MRNFKPISTALDGVLKKIGLFSKMKSYTALLVWKEIVGEKISTHTNPVFVKNGCLIVNVDNSTWMNELSIMKKEIIKNLNQKIGMIAVKDIHFHMGKLTDNTS